MQNLISPVSGACVAPEADGQPNAPIRASGLFRSEARQAQTDPWRGAIRLAQPISNWITATITLFITIALLAYIALGEITKKARVTGIIVPTGGAITITAPTSGTITRQMVKEGQAVNADTDLFELSTERHAAAGEITALVAQQIALRQQSLEAERRTRTVQDAERRRAIDQRARNLIAERQQLEQEIALAVYRVALAKKSLQNHETLQRSGFVSAAQTQQKQEELIDIRTRLSTLKRAKVQLNATILALDEERISIQSDFLGTLNQLERAQASVAQENVENQGRQLTRVASKQAGILASVANEVGQPVLPGQVLATVVPRGTSASPAQLEVHLYASSRTSGFVVKGQPVQIRYQAFPYQKFGLYRGTIIDVSTTPFAPSALPANVASTILSNARQTIPGFNENEALYRFKVRLEKQSITAYGQEISLKPGMTLEADVLQERRKLWEWIFEPLLSIANR